MGRGLALAVLVLVILDTGIVQQGPHEGRPWILWYDTATGRQWLEEDPTLYHMDPEASVKINIDKSEKSGKVGPKGGNP